METRRLNKTWSPWEQCFCKFFDSVPLGYSKQPELSQHTADTLTYRHSACMDRLRKHKDNVHREDCQKHKEEIRTSEFRTRHRTGLWETQQPPLVQHQTASNFNECSVFWRMYLYPFIAWTTRWILTFSLKECVKDTCLVKAEFKIAKPQRKRN